MASEALLEVDSVSSGYGPVRVLHEVTLDVGKGEVVSVVGANGAGKSTLLRTIAGGIRATAGDVRFGERSMARWGPARACREGLGHAPEGRKLFRTLTVGENLDLGTYAIPRGRRAARRAEQLELVHSLFPILFEFRDRAAGSLSGGQQQMLSLGRALMGCPSLLLLDEPSMGLAPGPVADIAAAVRRLSQGGMSVLLVEQVVGLALSMSTRTYVLREGRVVASGDSSALANEHDRMHEAYFGVARA